MYNTYVHVHVHHGHCNSDNYAEHCLKKMLTVADQERKGGRGEEEGGGGFTIIHRRQTDCTAMEYRAIHKAGGYSCDSGSQKLFIVD